MFFATEESLSRDRDSSLSSGRHFLLLSSDFATAIQVLPEQTAAGEPAEPHPSKGGRLSALTSLASYRGLLENSSASRDPYAAFRHRDFRLLFIGRFITTFGGQMLSFAIGWELWLRTRDTFALGLVGLVQVVPVILLSLPGGHLADQYNRKRIVFIMQTLLALCSLGLAYLSYTQGPILWIYACLLGIGIARAFYDPAASTLLPQTVPPNLFTSAATWSSSAWQFAAIFGPMAGGVIAAWLGKVTIIYGGDVDLDRPLRTSSLPASQRRPRLLRPVRSPTRSWQYSRPFRCGPGRPRSVPHGYRGMCASLAR